MNPSNTATVSLPQESVEMVLGEVLILKRLLRSSQPPPSLRKPTAK